MAHHLQTVLKIKASAEKVWQVLDDYAGVEKFSIGIDKSPLVGDKKSGLGAVRHCIFHDQSSLHEEIIDYQAYKSFKVVLSNFTVPMKFMHAAFNVEKLSDTSCKVTMNMDFEVKFGLLGKILGALVIGRLIKRVNKDLLLGLAYYTVTGKTLSSELPSKEELAPALV
ncbi:MAG: SRPBCC family protein [Oleispira sp.]|nr:SRPBCC family protein [Oleispira sp.]